MDKIDWKRKLSSRKFWAMLAGFVVSVMALFNMEAGEMQKVVAMITAFGSVAVYILSESYIDGKTAKTGDEFVLNIGEAIAPLNPIDTDN